MVRWKSGDTVVVRNIARSDGTVATAIPGIVIRDDQDLLAIFVPNATPFKNNWVVPPAQRVASVDHIVPSAQRQYRDLIWRNSTIRLYLPGCGFSVWLAFNEDGEFATWYGNLEAPFIRTRLGINTRDYALDIVADAEGRWQWKDEDEFSRRLEVGIDSAEHQARVRSSGWEFINCFQKPHGRNFDRCHYR